jgi:multidrug efflux pump subunit AcrA (membrane-fusion protein)
MTTNGQLKANEFETEDGRILTLTPVNPALIEMRAARVEREFEQRGEPIHPPTYQAKMLGGEIQEMPLSDDLLIAPGGNEEETQRRQAAWARYQDALERLEEAKAEQRLAAQLALGVDCDYPQDGFWVDKFRWITGEDPPTDPLSRKAVYLIHTLQPSDLQRINAQLAALTAGKVVTREDVDAFQNGLTTALRGTVSRATQQVNAAVQRIGQESEQLENPDAVPGESREGGQDDASPSGVG